MSDITLKRGDRLPLLDRTLLDENDNAVDLTGATVRFIMRAYGATNPKISAAATVLDADEGRVRYSWGATDTDTAGHYQAEFEVTFSNGRKETFPNDHHLTVDVVADLDTASTPDAFATVGELANALGADIAEDDRRASQILRTATAIIQAECRHRIFFYEDDEKKLRGTWSGELFLPEPPVTEVTSVTVGDTEVADASYEFSSDGGLRGPAVWTGFDEPSSIMWGGPSSEVVVTYSHGYDPIPEDIKAVCLSLAARLYDNPSGAASETIGSYSYSGAGEGGALLTDYERSICHRYRPVVR